MKAISKRRPRRAWGLRMLLGCLTLLCGCAGGVSSPPQGSGKAVTHRLAPDLKVHALWVGSVQVKENHRELDGIESIRFLSIMMDFDWAPWMPILVYVIEHPDGVILVDSGADMRINDQDFYDCDPDSRYFYTKNLKFALPSEEHQIVPQLAKLGITPDDVKTVVITHFHADHVGGLAPFANTAQVLMGPGGDMHPGASTCRIPASVSLKAVRFSQEPAGVFPKSKALTKDGRVRVVALPGHTTGHVGVLVQPTPGESGVMMVGDATFDDDQTSRGAVSGVSEHVEDAKETQTSLAAQRKQGTILLPSHDVSVFEKLAQ